MIPLQGDRLPPDVAGKDLPYPIGRLRQVPLLPVCVGLTDRLAVAVDGVSRPSTVVLTDPSVVAKLATSGKGQLDGERFTWAGKDAPTATLTGITWAVDGSTAAGHSAGTTFYEWKDTLTYCLGEVPHGPVGYGFAAVDAVQVNGATKAPGDLPTHTIHTNDTSTVPGRRTVTVVFDMTTLPADVAPFTSSSGGVLLGCWAGWSPTWSAALRRAAGRLRWTWLRLQYRLRRLGLLRPLGNERGQLGGGNTLTGFSSPLPAGAGALFTPTPTAPALPQGAALTTPSQTRPRARNRVVTSRRFPAPFLGQVTADVRGITDDSVGTISGTPSLLLERPVHVTRFLMTEAFRAPLATLGDWTATDLVQAGLGLTWAVLFQRPMPFSTFQELVGLQGRAELFERFGTWEYRLRQKRAAVYTADASRFLEPPTFAIPPEEGLATVLPVTWGTAPFDGDFRLGDSPWAAEDRLGATLTGRSLALPWIQDEVTARTLARYWYTQWDHPRLHASVVLPLEALLVQLADPISLQTPLLSIYGDGDSATFVVRTWEQRLQDGQIALTVVEDDAALDFDEVQVLTEALVATRALAREEAQDLVESLTVVTGKSLAETLTLTEAYALTVSRGMPEETQTLGESLSATPGGGGGSGTVARAWQPVDPMGTLLIGGP